MTPLDYMIMVFIAATLMLMFLYVSGKLVEWSCQFIGFCAAMFQWYLSAPLERIILEKQWEVRARRKNG